MKICVVGGGKMGLPLACKLAERADQVVVCDINEAVVNTINSCKTPVDEPGLHELLTNGIAHQRIVATTSTREAVAHSDAVIVIVPALLDERQRADLAQLESVAVDIATALKPGTLVCFETTVPVGSTRKRFMPILEQSGLRAGVDFDLAFSPERVKSLYVLKNLRGIPKIIGGVNERSAARAAEFYSRYLGASILNVGSLEAAEYAKIAGMVYRDVNIALANELAAYAENVGLDFEPIRQAANTDGEAIILRPGIGVGGHCTPIYPYFLIEDAAAIGEPAKLAELSRMINDGQAARALDRLERQIGPLRDRRVVVLGVAFRPGVRAHICSPAFLLRSELERRGADAQFHDLLFTAEEIRALGFLPCVDIVGAKPEIIILNTAHDSYFELDFAALAKAGLQVVVDGRAVLDPDLIERNGMTYVGVGKGNPSTDIATSKHIPLALPDVDRLEARAAADTIRTGQLTQGPQVPLFESEFAAYVGAHHACAVSSGTAALHLAFLAAGVGLDDEVITVSHSFIATANSVRLAGATPVFVDIEPDSFNIDVIEVEKAITPRTKAILCVHQMGMPCDLACLTEIAAAHKLILIEDAACAIGSEILVEDRWERIGKPHGLMACFSFHPRKLLTCGEGGMVTCADPILDALLRRLRNHGLDPSAATPTALEVGYNYRMSEMQAAMGRQQLQKLPYMLRERRRLVDFYRTQLARIPGVVVPSEPDWARTNWQSLCVRLPGEEMQKTVISALSAAGVQCRPGITNAHQQPSFRNLALKRDLPHSEQAASHCVILPLYTGLTKVDVRRIVEVLARAVANGSAIPVGAHLCD